MNLHESLGTPRKAKIDPGVRYRWMLYIRCERMKHLKTNCFKHSFIDPRKTDTCCLVSMWIHSII